MLVSPHRHWTSIDKRTVAIQFELLTQNVLGHSVQHEGPRRNGGRFDAEMAESKGILMNQIRTCHQGRNQTYLCFWCRLVLHLQNDRWVQFRGQRLSTDAFMPDCDKYRNQTYPCFWCRLILHLQNDWWVQLRGQRLSTDAFMPSCDKAP